MKNTQWIYNAYFKAQDAFFLSCTESEYEADVIYDYIYYSRLLSSRYCVESEHKNPLLCEFFLRQTFSHFISAIQDSSRSMTFRQLSLDSIHNILFELRKFYLSTPDGTDKYLAMKYQLQTIHI